VNPRAKALLPKLVHFLTAFGILMKGIAKLEHPEGYLPVILLFFAASAYIAIITLLHGRLHRHERVLDASVYAIECLLMAIVAGIYSKEGARLLPYVFAFASLGFGVATIVRLVKHAPHPQHT
jgi:hypothetical protein